MQCPLWTSYTYFLTGEGRVCLPQRRVLPPRSPAATARTHRPGRASCTLSHPSLSPALAHCHCPLLKPTSVMQDCGLVFGDERAVERFEWRDRENVALRVGFKGEWCTAPPWPAVGWCVMSDRCCSVWCDVMHTPLEETHARLQAFARSWTTSQQTGRHCCLSATIRRT